MTSVRNIFKSVNLSKNPICISKVTYYSACYRSHSFQLPPLYACWFKSTMLSDMMEMFTLGIE